MINYGDLYDITYNPAEYEHTNDYESRTFALQVLNNDYPGHEILTFKTEKSEADLMFNGHPIEVKTRDKRKEDVAWTSNSFNYDDVPSMWDTDSTYTGTIENIESTYSQSVPSIHEGQKYYMLKASDSHYRFMHNNRDKRYNCKWRSITSNKEGLMLICRDGFWLYNHRDLMEAFRGYGKYTEWKTSSSECKYKQQGRMTYVMALIELDDRHWHPCNVPLHVTSNHR